MQDKNLRSVEPEALQNLAADTESKVGEKWVNHNVKPAVAKESDRKTGKISDGANSGIQKGYVPTM